MDIKEQPAGLDDTPALTFDEIEQRTMGMLQELDLSVQHGATPIQVLDMADTIILGTLKELLKTLKACNIEPKKIIVPGASGHG